MSDRRTRTALAFDLRCEAAQLPVAVAELLHDAAERLELDENTAERGRKLAALIEKGMIKP